MKEQIEDEFQDKGWFVLFSLALVGANLAVGYFAGSTAMASNQIIDTLHASKYTIQIFPQL